VKRISTEAYQALRDALATVTWFKRSFESLVKTLLREHPELVIGLNFADPKRAVADELVDLLATKEAKYQEVTLSLMLELAAKTSFPDIQRLDEPDRTRRLDEARMAVALLAAVTAQYASHTLAQEQLQAEREAQGTRRADMRRFEQDITSLRVRFLALQSGSDPRQRGYDFETLLTDVFKIFDLEPRLAYRIESEQIDGSLSFNTDDYILEAKWLAQPVDRAAVDVFDQKVRRKGKNALGLFVAVNGFTSVARTAYSQRTSFLTMDGADLFAVLDARIRLDDLLLAKRRHANETGSCYLPAHQLLDPS
jgi:hypothetical protein